MFLAVTAEEKGLLGSEYTQPIPSIRSPRRSADLNIDALDDSGSEKNFTVRGTAKLDLLDDLIAAGKRRAATSRPTRTPRAGGFYRSDHFSFAKWRTSDQLHAGQ